MFPVKNLPDRYKIGKTTIYEEYFSAMKMSELGEPLRKGHRTFDEMRRLLGLGEI